MKKDAVDGSMLDCGSSQHVGMADCTLPNEKVMHAGGFDALAHHVVAGCRA